MTERIPLNGATLHTVLVEQGPYEKIIVKDSTGSTNTDLVALAKDGAPAWTAEVAESQSSGHGRHGRPWVTPALSQVALSVLIRPPHTALARIGTMPLAAGLAVVDALTVTADDLAEGNTVAGTLVSVETKKEENSEKKSADTFLHQVHEKEKGADFINKNTQRKQNTEMYAGSSVGAMVETRPGPLPFLRPVLKWPNDGLLDGRKVCGILAEAVSLGDEPALVVGLGLNVSLTREELPVAHATSLDLCATEHGYSLALNRETLVARILLALNFRLNAWAAGSDLLEDYRTVCATLGSEVTVSLPSGALLAGRATGISSDGCLLVTDMRGDIHTLSAGDVTHVRAGQHTVK